MTDLCTSGGSIEELRKVIDATDTELFGLLEKRAKLARSIGKLKAAGAVYKPEREREIFERTVARAKAEGTLLSEEAIRNIVREIVSACRAVEVLTKCFMRPPAAPLTLRLFRWKTVPRAS